MLRYIKLFCMLRPCPERSGSAVHYLPFSFPFSGASCAITPWWLLASWAMLRVPFASDTQLSHSPHACLMGEWAQPPACIGLPGFHPTTDSHHQLPSIAALVLIQQHSVNPTSAGRMLETFSLFYVLQCPEEDVRAQARSC